MKNNNPISPFLTAKAFESHISELIDQKNYNSACDFLSKLVGSLSMDERFKGKQIFLPELDKLVQRISFEILEPLGKKTKKNSGCPVIIATEMYREGGHSRIIEEIIRSRGGVVVITNYLGGLRDKESAPAPPIGNLPLLVLPADTPLNNIVRLNEICNEIASEVYLLAHHHDVVAYSALSNLTDSPVFFIHASDHRVSLGATFKNFIHVDIAPHMHDFCKKFLKGKIDYWPQGVEDLGAKFFSYPLSEICTASSGTYIKFSWKGPLAYPVVLRNRLKLLGGSHFHIGQLSDSALDMIKRELQENAISLDRFKYIGTVKSLWQTLLDSPINIFLGSAPMHGLRTAIEVQGAGIPIIPFLQPQDSLLHENNFYGEQTVFWDSAEKLGSIISGVISRHQSLSISARNHYIKTFHPDLMQKAINESIANYRENINSL